MDFLKSSKGGSFGLAGGRIPEGGACAPPPPPSPLNPPLVHSDLWNYHARMENEPFCNNQVYHFTSRLLTRKKLAVGTFASTCAVIGHR